MSQLEFKFFPPVDILLSVYSASGGRLSDVCGVRAPGRAEGSTTVLAEGFLFLVVVPVFFSFVSLSQFTSSTLMLGETSECPYIHTPTLRSSSFWALDKF